MDYHKEFIIDFATRTRANLEFIELAEKDGSNVYEVTQLCNSLLGLLMFPKERYMNRIPDTPLSELVNQGWPEIKTTAGALPQENLCQLMRMLRNSIAHCNVDFVSNDDKQIIGIKVWNMGRIEVDIRKSRQRVLNGFEDIDPGENGVGENQEQNPRKRKPDRLRRVHGKTWEAELSISDLRTIAFKFIELLEADCQETK